MKKGIVLSKRMEAVVNMVLPQSLVVKDGMKNGKDDLSKVADIKDWEKSVTREENLQIQGVEPITVADIGCDHAYVPIALVERQIASKVIAMDVRQGPLEIAKKNVAAYGLNEKIELRLSDGMEKLIPGEVDAVIIAGMGGLLMVNILEQGIEPLSKNLKPCLKKNATFLKVNRPFLILQPQSDIRKVRDCLLKSDYVIEREQMLVDEGKYYTVIRAIPAECQMKEDSFLSGDLQEKYCEVELVYGRFGLLHKDEVLFEFLQKESSVLKNIAAQLQNSVDKKEIVPERTRMRLESVQKEIQLNQEAFSYYNV